MATSRKFVLLIGALMCLSSGPATTVNGQFAPPPSKMGGGAAAPAGAAKGTAAKKGAAAQNNGPLGGLSQQQMMMMYAGGGANPGMQGMQGLQGLPGAPGGTQTPTPSPTPKRYPALKGQRVYDAVSYRRNRENATILDDVRRIEISEDELPQYSDDGKTLGDFEANDGVYSQILPPSTNDYIGGTTNFYLQRIITMLRNAEELDPLDFFGLQATTTERFSDVAKLRQKTQEQMAKVASIDKTQNMTGWAQTFLKDFRVDPKDPYGRFFPLYVPRYPEPPSVPPLPAPWKPYGAPSLMAVGTTGMGMGPMGGMGPFGGMGAMPGGGNPFGPVGGSPNYVGRARAAAGAMGQQGQMPR